MVVVVEVVVAEVAVVVVLEGVVDAKEVVSVEVNAVVVVDGSVAVKVVVKVVAVAGVAGYLDESVTVAGLDNDFVDVETIGLVVVIEDKIVVDAEVGVVGFVVEGVLDV